MKNLAFFWPKTWINPFEKNAIFWTLKNSVFFIVKKGVFYFLQGN